MQRSESAKPRGCRFTGSVAASVAIDRRPSVQQFSRKGELECESERCCWQRLSLPRWSVARPCIRGIYVPDPSRSAELQHPAIADLSVTVKENPAQHTCDAAVDDLNSAVARRGAQRGMENRGARIRIFQGTVQVRASLSKATRWEVQGRKYIDVGPTALAEVRSQTTSTLKTYEYVLAIRRIGWYLLQNARSLADQLASPSDSQARTSAIASSNGSARPAASAIAKPESRSASRVFASSGWRNASSAGSRRMPVRSV